MHDAVPWMAQLPALRRLRARGLAWRGKAPSTLNKTTLVDQITLARPRPRPRRSAYAVMCSAPSRVSSYSIVIGVSHLRVAGADGDDGERGAPPGALFQGSGADARLLPHVFRHAQAV